MSNTVGKITGQMLESNLVRRDMQTGDENLAFETDLIFLDVWNRRVGISTDTPFRPLAIDGTLRTSVLLVDTQANIADSIISSNTISNLDSDIFLSAIGIGGSINAETIQVDGLQFDTNRFVSRTSNENIDIFPNVSGEIIFNSNVEVFGNLHATGNVTFDGSVTLGDADTDSIIINADVAGNIIPNLNSFYSLGSTTKRFSNLFTDLVNGTSYTASSLTTPGGIDFSLRQGNIWYVSSNGSNSNVGDHPNGPFATVEFALANSTTGDTVYIYPGTYMENFPLTVPAGVAVKGESIRSVKIIPQASSNDQDAFLLNGQSTISDITVANFFYNSSTNTGYAFRFANNFTVTSRSPYIQNISVITENESTLASAGRGAYIDGSVANSSSIEASMLFHSCTFITPNADSIIMKNGVRVEWLNSFVYFANRGLYAENGNLGFASLGIKFGAEIRSIGSANVYGNYGAWADGNQTLMYLINHNFGYIGSGLDSNNDPSEVIQANEIVELNGGKIYYQSMDQIGDFRVGDIFKVKSSTGQVEFQTAITSNANLIISDLINTTYIDALEVTTGNITISGNSIVSNSGEINFSAANNQLDINSSVNITESLDISNNINIDSNIILGNQFNDTVALNGQLVGNIIPTNSGQYFLGENNLRYNKLYASSFIQDDIVIDTNVISTTLSNSDLELKSNETGIVRIDDNLFASFNVIVSDNSSFYNVDISTLTANNIVADNLITIATTNTFDDIQFNGNRVSTIVSNADLEFVSNGVGIINILDSTSIAQSLSVDGSSSLQNTTVNQTLVVNNLNVLTDITASELSTTGILVKNNFITTTNSNSNLELRSNGTGIVNVQENLGIDSNLTVFGTSNFSNTNVNGNTVANNSNISLGLITSSFQNLDILIQDNFISTTLGNSDLILNANATGSVLFDDNLIINNNLTVDQSAYWQNTQVFSPTTASNINILSNLISNEFSNGDIFINTNFITTTTSNSNLEFRGTGSNSGVVLDQNLEFKSTTLSNILSSGTEIQRSIEFIPFTNQNFIINSTGALTIPVGNNTNRVLGAAGEIRLNNVSNRFEGRLTAGVKQLYGLYDLDQNTYISAELMPGTNDNVIRMFIAGVQTASITEQASTFQRVQIDELDINNNIISTVNSNANIEFVQSGTGIINIKDNFTISANSIQNLNANTVTNLETTGGYVEFSGNNALAIPAGTTLQRPASTQLGSSRWNTNNSQLEVWDGTVWTGAAGAGSGITANDMEELVNILTLVLA